MSNINANSPLPSSHPQNIGDVEASGSDTLNGETSSIPNGDVEAQKEKENDTWKASALHMIRTFSSLWYDTYRSHSKLSHRYQVHPRSRCRSPLYHYAQPSVSVTLDTHLFNHHVRP